MEIWGICTDVLKQDDVYRIYLKTDEGTIYQVSAHEMDVHWKIEVGRHYYAKGDDATETMKRPAIFADYVERWGRYCSHCGKHHEEGYYDEGAGLYACCDECLFALNKEDLEGLEEEREDGVVFWTEWYN